MRKNTIAIAAFVVVMVMVLTALVPLSHSTTSEAAPVGSGPTDGNFDPNAQYWISDQWVLGKGEVVVNTWFTDGGFWGDMKGIGGSNSVLDITVRDSLDPNNYSAYTAFCAHYGSKSFGQDDSYQAGALDPVLKANILSALNYIYDKYGSIDSWQVDNQIGWNGQLGQPYDRPITVEGTTNVLSQIAIWMLMDDNIDVIKAMYANPGGPDYSPCFGVFDDAVAEILAAVAAGYTGSGAITDLVYLVGPNFPDDTVSHQPQIVPIFGPTNYVEPTFGSLTIAKGLGNKASYPGSITGGYPTEAKPTVAKNGKETWDHTTYAHDLATKLGEGGVNWFQWNGGAADNKTAGMTFANAGDSYNFALVQGDKLTQVGNYTITYNGGTSFTVTFNDQMSTNSAHLSISNTILAAKNTNDKNYNKNNIWTTAPGQQQIAFSGNSFTFNATWLNLKNPVFVYIHLDGLSGYENTFGAPIGAAFDFKVTGPSFPNGELVSVTANSSVTLTDLIPGEYTVKEIASGWTATYYVDGGSAVTTPSVKVTVVGENNTVVRAVNIPGENKVQGEFSFQKMVENIDGTSSAGADFTFAAYDSDGNFIANATSNANGIVTFGPSEDIIPGEIYYVSEVTQSSRYVSTAGESFEIVAVEEGTVIAQQNMFVFTNYLAPGALKVTADVQENYYKWYYKPVYKTAGPDTLVSWAVNRADLPDGFTGAVVNNGFTYLKIDVGTLRALGDAGANIGIAKSDPSNTSIGYTYNVKIVGDKIVVTCSSSLFGSGEGFGIKVSDTPWTDNPNDSSLKHFRVEVQSCDLPAGDTVYLFFHVDKGEWTLLPLVQTGWALDHKEGPLAREYAGDVTMTVTNAAGDEVYSGALGLVDNLKAGEYTVSVTAGGEVIGTETVTVEPGETTNVDFGTLVLTALGSTEIVYL